MLTPLPLLLMLALAAPAAYAECAQWEKLDQAATAKLAQGKDKRALAIWRKALLKADDCEQKAQACAILHAKIAQCYLQLEDFPACDDELKQAEDGYKALASANPDVAELRSRLSKVYRSIDLSEIGSKVAADLFKKAGIETVGISKLAEGNRIELFLTDKFRKTIHQPPINKVMLDKLVSFDLLKAGDGTIQLNHIHGFLLRAKVWISIKRAIISPETDLGEPTATVTAEKLGLSKTVAFKMPVSLIDPLETLVLRIKDFSDGKPMPTLAVRRRNLINFFTKLRKPPTPAPLLHSADVLKPHKNDVVESLPK